LFERQYGVKLNDRDVSTPEGTVRTVTDEVAQTLHPVDCASQEVEGTSAGTDQLSARTSRVLSVTHHIATLSPHDNILLCNLLG
jgi:hypothetical protein